MNIRLRLIVAFFLLAVLPLTGLVLYSYHSSLQAVRQSTEEEAFAASAELERRMEETRSGLAARFVELARMSEPMEPVQSIALPDPDNEADGDADAAAQDRLSDQAEVAAEVALRQLMQRVVESLGDDAQLVESFSVMPSAPEPPGDGPQNVRRELEPLPPASPNAPTTSELTTTSTTSMIVVRDFVPSKDPIRITVDEDGKPEAGPLFVDGEINLDFDDLEDAENFEAVVETLASGAEFLRTIGALAGLEEKDIEFLDGPVRFKIGRDADEDRWTAFLSSEDCEHIADEHEACETVRGWTTEEPPIEQLPIEDPDELPPLETGRLAAQEHRKAQREHQRAARKAWEERNEAMRKETEDLLGGPLSIPLRRGDRLVGQMQPQIRAEALLGRVLTLADREQGEIPFAVDDAGQLFVAQEEDRTFLEGLDLDANGPPDVQEVEDQPWVVATVSEEAGNFTFGIARPLGEPLEQVRSAARRNFLYGLALIGLALFGIVPLSRRITGDLQRVTAGAERIAAGDLDTRVEVRSKDEIGQLATTFNTMAGRLAQHEERLVEDARRRRDEELARQLLEADVDRKTQELEEAREFQLSLLPKSLPQSDHFEFAVEIRTATEVGGDYYDFTNDDGMGDDGRLTLAIGDATGHGAKAGTMVTVIKSLFSAYRPGSGLANFLSDAAQTIRRMDLGRMSMALSVAELRPRQLRLSAAGMPPVLLYRAATSTVDELTLTGLPLGSRLTSDYDELSVDLEAGDTLLLTTDGVPELLGYGDPSGEPPDVFGYERLRTVFQASAGQGPATVVQALRQAIDDWSAEERPNDDITVLVIEVK